MNRVVFAEPTNHPSRETSDHANLDPRRPHKHPKAQAERRSAPVRRADRAG